MLKRRQLLSVFAMAFALAGCEIDRIVIVVPEKPTASETFAAGELKYHLEKATGRELPIVPESVAISGCRRFYVGHVKALASAGVSYADFKVEERLVKGVGGDVFFAGGELPDYEKIRDRAKDCDTYGLAGGGTLYAVYDFLEREMGVKWLWPGELGEVIPQQAVPSMAGVERRGIEPLVERCLRGDNEQTRRITIANRLWGWKDAENARKEVRNRRLWLTRQRVGKREAFNFGHAFRDWTNRYRESHPEYLAKQPDGRRDGFKSGRTDGNQYYPLCVSNPHVSDIIVSGWAKSCKDRFKPGVRPPYINCCENDSPGFCTCANCRAWDAPDPRFATHPYWNGRIGEVDVSNRFVMATEQWGDNGAVMPRTEPPSVTDRYVRFYNTVLAKARKVHPLAGVCAYAYSNYRLPPIATRVADGFVLGFVPGVIFPYAKEQSDQFRRDWGGWNAMGAAKIRYRPNYMFGGGNMPYSSARHFADDMNFAYAHGMMAVDQDSLLGAWSAQALKSYVAGRILRAPETTFETMLREFCAAFGNGAADVRAYCEMLEALNDRFTAEEWKRIGRENRSKNGSPGGGWRNFVMNIADLYSEEWFAKADGLLVHAEKVTDGVARRRVVFLRKGLKDGLLTYRTRVAQKSGDKAKFRAAFDAMVAYRASVEADGVCAYAWFADVEDTLAGWPHRTQKYWKEPTASFRIRDPFVLADGGRYYLYESHFKGKSYASERGVFVRESADLRNWTEPHPVMTLPDDTDCSAVWAPEVHRYCGSYWLFATLTQSTNVFSVAPMSPAAKAKNLVPRGTWVFKAPSPRGPFVPVRDGPVPPRELMTLDGTLYVENGQPYMVYCHEWCQMGNGTIEYAPLTSDLASFAGTPKLLLSAPGTLKGASHVTDGVFFWRSERKGRPLYMIWSNFVSPHGYCVLIRRSASGAIAGPWSEDRILFDGNGGHGMIFKDLEGKLRLVLHCPQRIPDERLLLCELRDDGEWLSVVPHR